MPALAGGSGQRSSSWKSAENVELLCRLLGSPHIVLGEPDRLRIWPTITNAVSSELIRLECLRTIDRARMRLDLPDRQVAQYRADLLEAVDAFSLVALDSIVLERASEPFPTALGSLDAIHLASALLIRDDLDGLAFATHDDQLGMAARATGFQVHGVSR